ncbi:hypothetical protein KAI87_14570, partial [Myxococcota bacterium]|nr:hypothetical protein [Myxococcota bacterium]
MKRFPLVFATLAFAAFSITTHAQAADSAGLARTKALVDTFIQVKSSDDDALSKADQAANAKVFTKLDGFFDFKRLTSDTVKKQASKFNAAQKADFEKTFTA